jgi:hypothetical protein
MVPGDGAGVDLLERLGGHLHHRALLEAQELCRVQSSTTRIGVGEHTGNRGGRMGTVVRHRGAARALLGAAALAASLGTAACSSGDKPKAELATSTTTASTAPTTQTSAPVPGEEAVAAYRGFWQDFIAAGDPMNPEDPRLGTHATGDQLAAVRKSFLAAKAAGNVIRGTLDLAPKTVTVEATTVVVRDCYGDATGLYSAATGARQDKETPGRQLVTATVVLADGVWKVSAIKHEGDGCTAS